MKMWKKQIGLILVLFVVLWITSNVGVVSVEATSNKEKKVPTKITLNYKKKSISVGDTITLKVKQVKPKGATKRVFWSSTNKKIATVSAKGKVKVKKSGNVTIVAKSQVNQKVVAKCKLRVYKATKVLKRITNPSYILLVGEQQPLSAIVTKPAKGAAPVQWSSLNEDVAKVSKDGRVKAVSQGETTILAKSGKKKVKTKIEVVLNLESVGQEENKDEIEVNEGDRPENNDKPGDEETPGGDAPTEDSNNPDGDNGPDKDDNTGNDAPTEDNNNPDEDNRPDKDDNTGNHGPTEDSNNPDGDNGLDNDNNTGNDAPSGSDDSPGNNDRPESDNTSGTQEPEVDVLYSGMQDGISWTLDINGKLSIFGESTKTNSTVKQLPQWCDYRESIKTAVVTAEQVRTTYGWFYGCYNLVSVDFSKFNTQHVTDMGSMFMGCSSLIKVDVGQFDTSSVTDMSCMFAGCSNLTSVNVKEFDTSNVEDMRGMFWSCSNLCYIYVSRFDTRKVSNMKSMFENCSSLTSIDVSKFDTANVTDMSFLFSGCSNVVNIDVSKFDTRNTVNMRGMFQGCSNLERIDVANFNTTKVTDLGYMFSRCKQLISVNVSGFDISQVNNMEFMFQCCGNLQQKIYFWGKTLSFIFSIMVR